mgnify:CR=1 FL=1
MSRFEDIKLEWGGKKYTIHSNNVMRAIAIIENTVTIHELHAFAARGSAPMAKLAIAYADVIKFAGGDVTSTDVYASMFSGNNADVPNAVQGLLHMMLPPATSEAAKAGPSKKSQADAVSSKKRTKQQSVKTGSVQKSSGA